MIDIKDFAKHLKCPTRDGIFYANGSVQLLDVTISWKEPVTYQITRSAVTSIDKLNANDELHQNSCAVLHEYTDRPRSVKMICGEAAYGSDGFVAMLDLNTNDLIWVAFFESSNPFCKIVVQGDVIHVTSTLQHIWEFDFNDPANVSAKQHG